MLKKNYKFWQKFSFMVYAISEDEQRRSDARVIINIQDINDHEPEFQYKVGKINIFEWGKYRLC